MIEKKIELLAPAGNPEKLKIALIYGADAVYIGGEEYGLRANAGNFSDAEMKDSIDFAHSIGKKVYITMNIIPHNADLDRMPEFASTISDMKADAVIVSDPGVFEIVRENAPGLPIHISTQANVTNYMTAGFWHRMGAARIVAARELSLAEIAEFRDKCPSDLQIEIFVHGSMCVSYSGRCLLSGYMTGRDSNRGDCSHPCRWKYSVMEEKRPGEYFPVYENERGTFIFNSKDLNMIRNIQELAACGIDSFKIEGRMKSAFYVAIVIKAYREALDAYYANGGSYVFDEKWNDELCKVSHRKFTTGFYMNENDESMQNHESSSYIRNYEFIGLVLDYNEETGEALVEQRNRMFTGDRVEVVNPVGDFFIQEISSMKNENGSLIAVAQHPKMKIYIKMDRPVVKFAMFRKMSDESVLELCE